VERLKNLREKLASSNLDGMLIGSYANRRYLSHFTGSAGWLIISPKEAILAVDFRYVEQAKIESPYFDTCYFKGDIANWLPVQMKELAIRRLGIESDHMSLSVFNSIVQAIREYGDPVESVPVKNIVESLRLVKNDTELLNIQAACKIADAAMSSVSRFLHPGITEKQVAWELECCMRQIGSQALPFEIIVASGPNAALPHAQPTDREILEGDPVTIDLGARYNGYCSDLTRTFMVGKAADKFYKVYNLVLAAQMMGLSVIESGMSAGTADALVRSMIDNAGFGEQFGHGLGHGIGIETHEGPRLGTRSEDIIVDNMVFTVEPGIYIPGWGGVRIEDSVAMKNGRLVSLTHVTKEAKLNGG
jgi:Xaa-Pro aminopeptidase